MAAPPLPPLPNWCTQPCTPDAWNGKGCHSKGKSHNLLWLLFTNEIKSWKSYHLKREIQVGSYVRNSFLMLPSTCQHTHQTFTLQLVEKSIKMLGWNYFIWIIQGDWMIWHFVARKSVILKQNMDICDYFLYLLGHFVCYGTTLWAFQSLKPRPSVRCAYIFFIY